MTGRSSPQRQDPHTPSKHLSIFCRISNHCNRSVWNRLSRVEGQTHILQNIYSQVQELQCTAAKANFHKVNNMSSNTTHATNTLHHEFQKFLANIVAENLEPPIPPTNSNHLLQTQVSTLEGQLVTMQQ